MYSKTFKNKNIKKNHKVYFNYLNDCTVSKASTALMLERFFCGKKIDFPF